MQSGGPDGPGTGAQRTSSRAAAATKTNVEQRARDATGRKARAGAELAGANQRFVTLLRQAGLMDVDALPDAEIRSDKRRTAGARLQDLSEQVARTSTKDVVTLRADLGERDSLTIDGEKESCVSEITRLEAEEEAAIAAEHAARSALATVDTSGEAAQAREEMESATARYRAGVRPWSQLKLAESLLGEALRRHREKAQGPVVQLAGEYFKLITDGRFVRLLVDDEGADPTLMAQPDNGKPIGIAALSESTGDQLDLALRLAALQVQRAPDRMMPLVLDDILITSDDERAANAFRALEKFSRDAQVLVFTHHQHLVDIATRSVSPAALKVHRLPSAIERAA